MPVEGLESLVPEFIEKRKIELPNLQSYIAQEDFDQIRQLTHRWKGFSAPYGFGRLGTLAEEMNTHAHAKDARQCLEIFNKMKDYLAAKEIQFKDLKF